MESKTANKRKMVGVVIKDKMDKTVVVEVEKTYKHRMYQKYLRTKRTCKAHDEQNTAKVGDQVLIVEARPLSKEKRWVVKEIIRKEAAVPAVEVAEQ
jgi:small subunit ribosomal protein S17